MASCDWGISKENVQPTGQTVKVTSAGSCPERELQVLIKEQKQQLERELKTYKGSDPLSIWYRYIQWAEQNLPSGGRPFISQLIEQCVTLFKDQDRYKNDPRNIEIWIHFAKVCSAPADIYSFMYNNGIGVNVAALYIAWASDLEATGNTSQAEATFNMGLGRFAKPTELLQEQYKAFQSRTSRGVQAAAAVDSKPYERIYLRQLQDNREGTKSLPLCANVMADPAACQSNPDSRAAPVLDGGDSEEPSDHKKAENQVREPTCSEGVASFQKVMYCKHLVYQGTEEFSLEEIHAKHIFMQEEQQRLKNLEEERLRMEKELQAQRDELAAILEQKSKMEREILHMKSQPVLTTASKISPDGVPSANGKSSSQMLGSIENHPKGKTQPLSTQVVSASLAAPAMVPKQPPPPPDSPKSNPPPDDSPLHTEGRIGQGSTGLLPEPLKEKTLAKPTQDTGLVRPTFQVLSDRGHQLPTSGITAAGTKLRSADSTPDLSIYQPFRTSSNKTTPTYGICAPSPTINTKEAMQMVMGMFNQTLDGANWDRPGHANLANDSLSVPPVVETKKLSSPFKVYVEEDTTPPARPPAPPIFVFQDQESQPSQSKPLGERQAHGLATDSACGKNVQQGQVQPLGEERELVSEYCQPLRGMEDTMNMDDMVIAAHNDMTELMSGRHFMDDTNFVPPLSSTMNFTGALRSYQSHSNAVSTDPKLPSPSESAVHGPSGHPFAQGTGPAACRAGSLSASPSDSATGVKNTPPDLERTSSDSLGKHKSNLSPITECSDEDTKMGASTLAASHIQQTLHPEAATKTDKPKASVQSRSPDSTDVSARPLSRWRVRSSDSSDPEPSPVAAQTFNQTCHEIDVTEYPMTDEADLLSQSVMVNPYNDPFDADLIEEFLDKLPVPIQRYPSYHRVGKGVPQMKAKRTITMGDDVYDIIERLGEGVFARVYLAQRRSGCREDTHSVIKVQCPPCPWEYYITCELHSRLKEIKSPVRGSIMTIDEAYFFNDGSCFVNELIPHGTLLDIVNIIRRNERSFHESLVVYMCIELLRILEALMAVDIIHGDVKPDNFLFRGFPQMEDDPSSVLTGETHCLRLIDFGRSIDMRMFPPGTSFGVSVDTSGFQCIEMKTQRPWTYQTDMFGIVGTMHVLIFGEYMNVGIRNDRWRAMSHFKRWFKTRDQMLNIFDELLNVPSCSQLPDVGALRRQLEQAFLNSLAGSYTADLISMETLLRDA